LRPFNILRAVSTVERLEAERSIISNGVKRIEIGTAFTVKFPIRRDEG